VDRSALLPEPAWISTHALADGRPFREITGDERGFAVDSTGKWRHWRWADMCRSRPIVAGGNTLESIPAAIVQWALAHRGLLYRGHINVRGFLLRRDGDLDHYYD